MPLYRNYSECQRVVWMMLPMFSLEGQGRLLATMMSLDYELTNELDSPIKDATMSYTLTQSLKTVLWEIPLAVEMGFGQWLRKEIPIKIDALGYHDKNCNEQGDCTICQEIPNM